MGRLLPASGESEFFGAVQAAPGLPPVTPTAKSGKYTSGALRNMKKALTFMCIPNIIVLLKQKRKLETYMKKIIALCLLTAMLAMAACGKTNKTPDSTSDSGSMTEAATDGQTSPESTSESVGATEAVTDEETLPESTQDTGNGSEEPGLYTYDHLTLRLPEGFTVGDYSGVLIAVPADYPARTDNISFSKGNADSIDNYTQEILDAYYVQVFAGFERSTAFEKMKIDGVDVLKYSYEITAFGVLQRQTQYLFFGSTYSDIITFSSVSGDFDEAFLQVVQSVKIS